MPAASPATGSSAARHTAQPRPQSRRYSHGIHPAQPDTLSCATNTLTTVATASKAGTVLKSRDPSCQPRHIPAAARVREVLHNLVEASTGLFRYP